MKISRCKRTNCDHITCTCIIFYLKYFHHTDTLCYCTFMYKALEFDWPRNVWNNTVVITTTCAPFRMRISSNRKWVILWKIQCTCITRIRVKLLCGEFAVGFGRETCDLQSVAAAYWMKNLWLKDTVWLVYRYMYSETIAQRGAVNMVTYCY